MEAQQPHWRQEEAQYAQTIEQQAVEHPEKAVPTSVELDERYIAAESIKLQAEIAPERFADSAEADEVTEKELELRHEIQDDPSDEAQAVSVGEVLADMPPVVKPGVVAAQAAPVSPSNTPAASTTAVDDSAAMPDSSISYAQAVKIGFVTALLLIALFALAQILT